MHNLRYLRLSGKLKTVALALVLMAALASCAQTATALPSVKLDFAGGAAAPASAKTFDEQKGYVIRCASLIEGTNDITVSPSKSKQVKATVLVFIPLPDAANPWTSTRIAYTPVSKSEGEYDMAQARYITVTAQSARSLVDNYGLLYDDWMTGTTSSSEKYPCCE